MTRIYTGKGDDGRTLLWRGGRVLKSSPRTEAYGTLDEAVSELGLARAQCREEKLAEDLLGLQRRLFVAAAELASDPRHRDRLVPGESRLTDTMVGALEERIDAYMAEIDLPPRFVAPGGTALAAQLDVCRTVLRRAERRVVDLAQKEDVSPTVLRFLNRASDLVFAMARYADVEHPELFGGGGENPG